MLGGTMPNAINELRVPFGVSSDGSEVRPANARRDERYLCPDCNGDLLLRAGSQRQRHFAHRLLPGECDFWHETEEHLRAKRLIAGCILLRKPVVFIRKCSECGQLGEQPMPTDIVKTSYEYRLPSGYRADVALFDVTGALRAVIEVCATHACEPEKVAGMHVPWAEFDASHLLTAGIRWQPIADCFRPYRCSRCRSARVTAGLGAGLRGSGGSLAHGYVQPNSRPGLYSRGLGRRRAAIPYRCSSERPVATTLID